MAANNSFGTLKCVLVIFDLAYILLGLYVTGVAISYFAHEKEYLRRQDFAHQTPEVLTAHPVLFATGQFLIAIGFLGCCGTVRGAINILGTVVAFMICAIVIEIGAGAEMWRGLEPGRDSIRRKLAFDIQIEYSPRETKDIVNQRVDQLQSSMQCCGIIGPTDWAMSRYNGVQSIHNESATLKAAFPRLFSTYTVPSSCCVANNSSSCEVFRHIQGISFGTRGIYRRGCLQLILEDFRNYATFAENLITVVVGMQIAGLPFALLIYVLTHREAQERALLADST